MNIFDGYDVFGVIASSTSSNIGSFMPVFIPIIGLTIALVVVSALVEIFVFRGRSQNMSDNDYHEDDIM